MMTEEFFGKGTKITPQTHIQQLIPSFLRQYQNSLHWEVHALRVHPK